jgi:hypothetical protein
MDEGTFLVASLMIKGAKERRTNFWPPPTRRRLASEERVANDDSPDRMQVDLAAANNLALDHRPSGLTERS